MPEIDYKKSPERYAAIYARLNIGGTIYPAYRDLPELIRKYVIGNKAIDYGSGAGKSTQFLKSLGFNTIGVDINPTMIKEAKFRDSEGNYLQIASGVIPVEDEEYDLAFASWVLMEIASKDEITKICCEIHRILKPGGIFITLVCNMDAYNQEWLTINTKFKENENLESGKRVKLHFKDIDLTIHDYFWSEEDYKDLFQKSSFELLEQHKLIGSEADGFDWINEDKQTPYSIYIYYENNTSKIKREREQCFLKH